MSDLRESGAIEQDADLILFIYRDEVYDDNSAYKGLAELSISKNRDGETGTVHVVFDGPSCSFRNFIGEWPNQRIGSSTKEKPFKDLYDK